jgi:hypothetical protein
MRTDNCKALDKESNIKFFSLLISSEAYLEIRPNALGSGIGSLLGEVLALGSRAKTSLGVVLALKTAS